MAPLRYTLQSYLELASSSPNIAVKIILSNDQFKPLLRFVSSSKLRRVERIFSHGGIFMRSRRASMSDGVLSDLVFAKCNALLTSLNKDSLSNIT